MIGTIVTSDHQIYQLPVLLAWSLTYTGGVPCDCFSVTCLYSADMDQVLHTAVSFTAIQQGTVMLRGIVDEYQVRQDAGGRMVTIAGRGYAARLLDNESRPMTYPAATLSEIIRNHVTPYGISCESTANLRASSVYTVASGSSQWSALEGFCSTYGGFSPRFSREGGLIAVKETGGKTFRIDDTTSLLSCSKRENHYGVLSEVLVIDKTRNVSYSVKNTDFFNRGGQCRRVLYTPGQSTWAAMRYTGEYQIRKSKADEITLELLLPGLAEVQPGDTVQLSRTDCGWSGTFRAAEISYAFSAGGETTALSLKARN